MWTMLNFNPVLQSIFGLQSWRYKCFDSQIWMKYWRVLKLPFQNKNETFEMLIIKQRGNDRRGQRLTAFCERFSPLKKWLALLFFELVRTLLFSFFSSSDLLSTLRNSSSEAIWNKYMSSLHFSNLRITPPAWNICQCFIDVCVNKIFVVLVNATAA